MDFLDPRRKRSHTIRLITGYVLVSIAIGLATIILVYAAYGYGINTKTGEIIQNGIVFVSSKPTGAELYLNGQDQNATTGRRLVLEAGNYTLTLKKSGYRDWQRQFTLDEHSIARYTYPLLFPVKPRVTNLMAFSSMPPLMTETPDQHWLLVQAPSAGLDSVNFDEFDTTNLTKPSVNLSLPAGLLSGDDKDTASLVALEWSSDNSHLLLRHDFSGSNEFILFDRAHPSDSINLNKQLKTDPSQVALRNKKSNQVYFYDAASQSLTSVSTSQTSLPTPFLKQVLAFKSYGSNTIVYATAKDAPTGKVEVRIWDNGQTYLLDTVQTGDHYLIDTAQYQGTSYFVSGSDTDPNINIYKDPLSYLKNSTIGKAVPTLAINQVGSTNLSFSTKARFIEVENGQQFGVYDFETQQVYQYKLATPPTSPLVWMDGQRLIGDTDGNVFVTDYDSTNQQSLTPTVDMTGGLFSADYNHLLTIQPTSTNVFELVNVDLRAGTDLPKQ